MFEFIKYLFNLDATRFNPGGYIGGDPLKRIYLNEAIRRAREEHQDFQNKTRCDMKEMLQASQLQERIQNELSDRYTFILEHRN